MSATVFVAVIGAALLHAAWNAMLKDAPDKHLSMAAVVLGHIPLAVVALIFAPVPDLACLPYLLAGIVLHVGYQIFLLNAYRIGDLTQVYPIARGSAPILVAAFSVLVLGVKLGSLEIAGITMIAASILSLGLVRHTDGSHNRSAAALALATGCFIAAYSLVDGLGARLAGSPLGFYGWLSLGNGLAMTAYTAITSPGALRRIPTAGKRYFVIGGSASFAAFSIVIWAFTQAPIALVTALRETSIVFALLIGVYVLNERLDLRKVVATMLTILGAIVLRFAKP